MSQLRFSRYARRIGPSASAVENSEVVFWPTQASQYR